MPEIERKSTFDSRGWRLLVVLALLLTCLAIDPENLRTSVRAQTPDAAGPLAGAPIPATGAATAIDDGVANSEAEPAEGIHVLQLANEGGVFMYPLYALSILAVGVIIERSLALRMSRVMPRSLVTALGQVGDSKNGFDPKLAYRECQKFPSASATVVRAMLLKVGRPHSEVELTVQQASEREANRLYGNVRWLNLCATLAPLIGLLGTVQGMIIAFHRTTIMAVGANKSVELANGIYTALVTTFGGLCIAIPASFAAHYFEGRIQTLFHDLDELLFNLLPQIERFEGRVRFQTQSDDETLVDPAVPPPPVPTKKPLPGPKLER